MELMVWRKYSHPHQLYLSNLEDMRCVCKAVDNAKRDTLKRGLDPGVPGQLVSGPSLLDLRQRTRPVSFCPLLGSLESLNKFHAIYNLSSTIRQSNFIQRKIYLCSDTPLPKQSP